MKKEPVSRIAELRQKKGLTQSELARILDVDISTVRNLERNRSGISALLRVINLCELFDCEAKDLVKYVVIDEQE